jgi:hypothetical protein
MSRLSVNELRQLCNEVIFWAEKAEEMAANMGNTTSDSAAAYALVHNDYIWKVKQKIGRLWFCVCGSEDITSFSRLGQPPVEALAAPLEPRDYTEIPTITQYYQIPNGSRP